MAVFGMVRGSAGGGGVSFKKKVDTVTVSRNAPASVSIDGTIAYIEFHNTDSGASISGYYQADLSSILEWETQEGPVGYYNGIQETGLVINAGTGYTVYSYQGTTSNPSAWNNRTLQCTCYYT